MKRKNILKERKWTLLVIGKKGNTREWQISKWKAFLFVCILCLSIFSLCYLLVQEYTELLDVKRNLFIKETQVEELTVKTEKQENELKNLRQKAVEFEKRLLELENLDKENSKEGGNEISDRIVSNTLVRKLREEGSLLQEKETLEITQLLLSKEKNEKNDWGTVPNRLPAKGEITSFFGERIHPLSKKMDFHNGIDVANNEGTEIVAAGSGIVTSVAYKVGFGNLLIIHHGNGYQTIYGHNQKILVQVGDYVHKGQVVALMGNSGESTGTHLHFEVRVDGKAVDPFTVIQEGEGEYEKKQ